jgi:hypothetical protein
MKNFKEKKLAEFDKELELFNSVVYNHKDDIKTLNEHKFGYKFDTGDGIDKEVNFSNIKQFISDLIDECEIVQITKELDKEIRLDTLKAVLEITDNGFDCICSGHIKDKAKEL